MDNEMVVKGVEELEAGRFSLEKLLEMAMEYEKHAARIMALSTCIKDGTLYKTNKVDDIKQHAMLMYILRAFRDTGDEIKKAAGSALSGDDDKQGKNGHAQRFAELLEEQGLQKVNNEIGTFYIKDSFQVIPPGKNDEKYREYIEWVNKKSKEPDFESMKKPAEVSWSGLQKCCEAMVDKDGADSLPGFFAIKRRREVRMRGA